MSLAAGTRLGPYEVPAHLGAGGMGEIYRARDTRLNRTVAMKVSNQEFSERFESEARAIASLTSIDEHQRHFQGATMQTLCFTTATSSRRLLHGDRARFTR